MRNLRLARAAPMAGPQSGGQWAEPGRPGKNRGRHRFHHLHWSRWRRAVHVGLWGGVEARHPAPGLPARV